MLHRQPTVQSFQDLHSRPGIAGAFQTWQQLQSVQLEPHRVKGGGKSLLKKSLAVNPRGMRVFNVVESREVALSKPESTVRMGTGVDTRVDGQGKANGPGPIPINGDEGGVR